MTTMKSIDSLAAKRIVALHETARVEEETATDQRSLHATKVFSKGDTITSFVAQEVFVSPTYATLQREEAGHITLSPSFLQYVNHACSPSAFFDTARMELVALKDIAEGEELTFFYPSTEWEMAQAFECRCGSAACLGTIRGAAFLPEEVLRDYHLTAFVQQKLEEQKTRKSLTAMGNMQ